MQLTNGVYKFVKFLAQLFFPAAGTLYATLTPVWNLPYSQQVVATIVAFDTFLGALLYTSSANYKAPTDGNIVIDQSDPTKNVMALEFNDPHGIIANRPRTVTLSVTGSATPDPISAPVSPK
jgi:hypothetical protein